MTSSARHETQVSTPLSEAIGYAAAGWPVFPTHFIHNGTCSCRSQCSSPGKHPLTKDGLHSATTDIAEIRKWWARWPNANVAIQTGEVSGLVVLDVDPAHGGLESLSTLIKQQESLPRTLTISTGSDGLHFYFARPHGEIRNNAGRLGAGLDVRGDGGYVIAPPSVHASGRRYFVVADLPIEPMPEWLVELVRTPVRDRVAQLPDIRTVRADKWAAAALRAELDAVVTAPEGTRNATLNRAAFNLGQIVGSGALGELDVSTSLISAGMNAGLQEGECCATVQSGIRAGVSHPRQRPTVSRSSEVEVP